MVRNDIDIFLFTKILIQADKNAVLQVHSVKGAKKIREDLKQHIKKNKQVKLQHSQFKSNSGA